MAASTATNFLLRNSTLFLRPLRLSTTTSTLSLLRPTLSFSLLPTTTTTTTHSLSLSSIPLNAPVSTTPHCDSSNSAPHFVAEPEVEERENEVDDSKEGDEEGKGDEGESTSAEILAVVEELAKREMPVLTVKEKKDLTSHAHSLGDKLKSQQVGKSGVTHNVIFALSETLESKELLKLKIHRSCAGELDDVVRQLEKATASVAISQIGRTVIFYRPSLTKLEAEKKKELNRKLFAQRRQRIQSSFANREQSPRRPGRYQPGSRRSEKAPS